MTSNDQMHINYVDADGHVHELWYQSPNGPWLHNDLTDISQGNPPSAAPGSALAGYETSANGQQHVNYLDAERPRARAGVQGAFVAGLAT